MAANITPARRASIKKAFPDEYLRQDGHLVNTAKALGTSWTTLAGIIKDEPALQEAQAEVDQAFIEDAAGYVRRLATGKERGNVGPSAFYLKARAGWTDRQEITHKHQGFEANAPAGVDGVLTLDGGEPPDTRGGRCDEGEVPPDNGGSSEVLDNVIQLAREGFNERS